MGATKINWVTLFDGLEKLDDNAKEIRLDKKERIEAFAQQFGVNKKAVALNYKFWQMLQKDEADFHEVTGDTDAFLTAIAADEVE